MAEENFVSDVVDKLKKQGLFDRFRKECLSDVDTKPAYQNLQIRVKEAVGKYLHGLKWKADLNKNQLRESLRRHLNELPMLTNGIDRVVDQVVKPKIMKSLKPQIDRVVCQQLNLDYEQWLSDQNDFQKKNPVKSDDMSMNVPMSTLPTQIPNIVAPSFHPVIALAVPLAPMLGPKQPPMAPSVITDLQPPPPPPPSASGAPIDPPMADHPPLPPCPPPPSIEEEEPSIPAPPPDPDVCQSSSSLPPLPPDDDDDDNDEDDDDDNNDEDDDGGGDENIPLTMKISPVRGTADDNEDVLNQKMPVNSEVICNDELSAEANCHFYSNEHSIEICAVDGSTKVNIEKMDTTSQISENRSLNDSNISNDALLSLPNTMNVEGISKEYRFAWNNFHESDLSNISVSSVHTSDLSNFEEDEVFEEEIGDPNNPNKNFSIDTDSMREGVNVSAEPTDLDISNISVTSSGRKKSKKDELKERKMEMKRRRILNKRYCNEEFMSIFNERKNDDNKDGIYTVTKSNDSHNESKIVTKEDLAVENIEERNVEDVDNAYSPYSNISEASSDSVVVVGVEPAVPRKGKKAKARKRSRSSDGSRRKKKRRKHRSSRRPSHHYSGDDDFQDAPSHSRSNLKDDDQKNSRQAANKNSTYLSEFENSGKYFLDDNIMFAHMEDGSTSADAIQNRKMKRSIDRINFGEAERQAAVLRFTGNSKQTSYPIINQTWQKQNHNTSSRSARHGFVNQQNFQAMASASSHVKHISSPYHQHSLMNHAMHETRSNERTKYIVETDEYRNSRSTRKLFHEEETADELSGDIESKIHKRQRQEVLQKQIKCHSQSNLNTDIFQNEEWPKKKPKNANDKKNRR